MGGFRRFCASFANSVRRIGLGVAATPAMPYNWLRVTSGHAYTANPDEGQENAV
jgi:hypothetical protein